jgi:hypothetical protein
MDGPTSRTDYIVHELRLYFGRLADSDSSSVAVLDVLNAFDFAIEALDQINVENNLNLTEQYDDLFCLANSVSDMPVSVPDALRWLRRAVTNRDRRIKLAEAACVAFTVVIYLFENNIREEDLRETLLNRWFPNWADYVRAAEGRRAQS